MIKGRKVKLRPPSAEDHVRIVAWRNDPRHMPYFFEEEPFSLDCHLTWFEKASQDPCQRYYVIQPLLAPGGWSDLADLPVAIGTASLYHIDWRNRTAESGRLLIGESTFRCGGYGLEALFLSIEHGFMQLNLNRIWAEILNDNRPSLRVYKGLGFKEEGCLRRHVFKQGHYRDVIRVGLLAEEFAVARPALLESLGLTERDTGG